MKTKLLVIITIIMLSSIFSLFAQGFQPPTEGKAVVYFVRVTHYGLAISFEYFHQDKYIGVFKGQNYFRYECDPGEQLFWASTENKEFVTADLKAGGTYIVIVDVIMGAWKARVGLTPISVNDQKLFERAEKLINKKKPIVTSEAKIENMNKKLNDFITEKLEKYNNDWKNDKNFKHISADMAIPPDAL
ncbi:MAG: hypothetical protein H8E34_08340 [Bacteroidetes bacterium]|nr:hypothetical protein [Bacteroidota bacterium]MBL6944468.1 hypothetical protein [Bacteroidales bacterium]